MDNQNLYELFNPWWQTKSVPADFLFPNKRKLFYKLVDEILNKKIISIVGLKRVGKSVLLYQLVDYLLNQNINPQNIFFLKADDPLLEVKKNIISDAVDFYEKTIARQSVTKTKSTVFFFIDEIQKIEEWGEYLKRYYDLGYNIKFFVSGSSSIHMVKTTKESLAGRNKEYVLYPLSFGEIIEWKKQESMPTVSVDKIFEHQEWARALRLIESQLKLRTNELNFLLSEYLAKGGFPELYFEVQDNYEYIKNEVIDRVLKRDIPEVTGIRNSIILGQILIVIARESGNVFSFREMSRKLGVNFETLTNYLFYLEQSFLITILRKYSRGGYSQARTMSKIHIDDPGILSAATGTRQGISTDSSLIGNAAEGIVSGHLKTLENTNLFFWRDAQGEVDFILEQSGQILPIEVKFQKNISQGKILPLERFKEKYHTKFSIVVTGDYLLVTNEVLFIPLFMFLLMV